MNLIKYIYYFFFDYLILVRNLKKDKNFIIIFPRFLSLLFGFVLLFDKKNKNFFRQFVRNKYDIITIHEIFGEESYNLTKFLIWKKVKKIFDEYLKNGKTPLLIDCGSNISSSTEYFCRIFKGIFPIMIEPNVESLSFGKRNLSVLTFIKFDLPVACEKKIVKFDSTNEDNRANRISDLAGEKKETVTINDILKDHQDKEPFILKIDIEGYEDNLFEKNYDWLNNFEIIIIEIHDWMIPNKAISSNFFNAVSQLDKKRDIIISGENIILVKIDEK